MAATLDLAEIAPLKRAPFLALGLGMMAGGFEAIKLSATLKLSMSFAQGLVLGLTSVALNGLLAAGLGLVAGLVVQLLTGRWLPYRRHAMGMAITAWLLGVWYLLPVATELYAQGRQPAFFGLGIDRADFRVPALAPFAAALLEHDELSRHHGQRARHDGCRQQDEGGKGKGGQMPCQKSGH